MLPSTLKNMNLFHDGGSFAGLVPEVTIPKLARKMDVYRGGGMDGEVQIDMGQEPIEFEWKPGGHITSVFTRFGEPTIDGILLRWMGAYQSDDTGEVKAVEVVVRGRHQEIDPGSGKPGDKTEMTVKTVCSYYKLVENGATLIEIDIANMVFIVNGVDRMQQMRAAIGL
ncbi:phage major tail tube protein [Asticcacaulis solisilvae]|uniref:phage major tail tube protein n=1 Tax=Asticcacaulis solisilvae TaxID=1217274 RepID=UPI003FD84F4A